MYVSFPVLKLPLPTVFMRFGTSCANLSKPLVLDKVPIRVENSGREKMIKVYPPKKTVLSLKPLNDATGVWGFKGVFKSTPPVSKQPGLKSLGFTVRM